MSGRSWIKDHENMLYSPTNALYELCGECGTGYLNNLPISNILRFSTTTLFAFIDFWQCENAQLCSPPNHPQPQQRAHFKRLEFTFGSHVHNTTVHCHKVRTQVKTCVGKNLAQTISRVSVEVTRQRQEVDIGKTATSDANQIPDRAEQCIWIYDMHMIQTMLLSST